MHEGISGKGGFGRLKAVGFEHHDRAFGLFTVVPQRTSGDELVAQTVEVFQMHGAHGQALLKIVWLVLADKYKQHVGSNPRV